MTLLEDEAAAPGARAELPLSGIRVVDLSTSYAGPTATMYLADLGAEVIKVERPGRGDDARGWGPPFTGGTSAWFASANRNKRSVVLDLRSPGARRVLHRLLAAADVFVENLNPAKLDGLGLSPRRLRARYPRLVYCALSGFGLDGPDATLPGYDLVAQARSGLMSVTGAADGAPQRVSTALSDIVAGMSAALAITAALRRQERTGLGDLVDVALLESDLALMAPRIAAFLAGEPEPRPSGGTDSVLAVYQPFATEDRPIVLAVGSEAIWRRLCDTLGLDGLADDPALASNAGRRAERERIVDAIQRRLRTAGAEEWLERLAAAGVPAAPVQRLAEVVADRQVAARGSVLRLDGADGPHFAVRSPWRLAAADPPARPAPPLGADTEAVLREHGFSDDEIDGLASEGAVQIGAEVAQ
ncbi:CaiB/BaiF CoA transferase family protein [Pseudonocardia acaciae]|uniref:CaiB/BaiF CoA transferase family protein n=1 Tax=Pseudonocardia acaciae TaxID=551276 RepID=UPI000ABF1B15|nr:CoA transferase [Pseudonocardia acaciae]